jgi:hypothetical protein
MDSGVNDISMRTSQVGDTLFLPNAGKLYRAESVSYQYIHTRAKVVA